MKKPILNPVDPHLQDPFEDESISEIRESLDGPEPQEGAERADWWKDPGDGGDVR